MPVEILSDSKRPIACGMHRNVDYMHKCQMWWRTQNVGGGLSIWCRKGVRVRKIRPKKTAKWKASSTVLLLDIMSLYKSKGIDVDRRVAHMRDVHAQISETYEEMRY